MITSTLLPPNNGALSDSVIGNVMQSSRPPRSSYVTNNGDNVKVTIDNAMIHEANCRRERRRTNQAMNRKKKHKLMVDLEECNQKLRQEVQDLELLRYVSRFATPTEKTVWAVAVEYFHIFRYGLKDDGGVSFACASKFLCATMAPDVTDGLACGSEALLTNWKLFSLYFDDIVLELGSLEKDVAAGSLVATTRMGITISKNTLRLVFPHLSSGGFDGTEGCDATGLSLAAQLVGQRLVIRGTVRFQWDDATKRVVTIHSQADMLTPMLHAVGNLENVNRVFERARITPECSLVSETSDGFQHWVQLLL